MALNGKSFLDVGLKSNSIKQNRAYGSKKQIEKE